MKTALTTPSTQSTQRNGLSCLYLLPGIIAYAPVQIFLSLVTLSKLFNDFPDSADLHPGDALCHYDQNIQPYGWTIGIIAAISNIGFTAKMLYNLNNKGSRTGLNKFMIVIQFIVFGIAAGLMNADNSYEASRYFFHRCDDPQKESWIQLLPLLIITGCSVFFSAISKVIAFTDEVQPIINLVLMAGHQLNCYEQTDKSLQRLRLKIICQQTALSKLEEVTADSEIKPKKVAINLVSLSIMSLLSYRYICFSYLEFGTRPTTQFIHYLNQSAHWPIEQSTSDSIANTMGQISWNYNSLVTAILLVNIIFTPRRPDFLATTLSGNIAKAVFLLSLVNSLPLFIIPFLQTSLNKTDQIITAITMVIGNFVTAWIGLADTIRELNDSEYKSRDKRTDDHIKNIMTTPSGTAPLLSTY